MSRHIAVHRRAGLWLAVALLACLLPLTSCKNDIAEAVSAAKGLQDTAQKLSAYYQDLSKQIDDTNALYDLDDSIPETASPSAAAKRMTEQRRTQLAETKAEIEKRAAMAEALAKLAAAYANLAGSTAPADASAAAEKLASTCTGIKQVESLGNLGPLPALLQTATEALVKRLQDRKLKQSASSIDQVVNQISALFEKEMQGYESINSDHIHEAATVARQLVNNDMFDHGALLKPALEPFGLEPEVADNPQPSAEKFVPDFRKLATMQIKARMAAEEKNYNDATQDLAASLKDSQQAIHNLAAKAKH